MTSENLYNILGLDCAAGETQIRKAYYDKVKLCHPDSANADTKQFEKIKRAYDELLDPVKRAAHDKEIGVRQSFGCTQLQDDIPGSSPKLRPLQFRKNTVSVAIGRFFRNLTNLFTRRKLPIKQTSESTVKVSSLTESDNLENFNKLTLAVYSEQSFPLEVGESLVLRTPQDMDITKKCSELVGQSLKRYPIISRAILIEATLASLPEESVMLIIVDKQIDRAWGIDALKSVEIESYPESLPGLLLCSAGEGPFAEAINLYGIEFYPGLSFRAIN